MLTPITLYSSVTLADGATPTNPFNAMHQLPQVLDTLTSNFLGLNFVMTTTLDPGVIATIFFKYGFSSTSYTPSDAPALLSNVGTVSLKVPSTASTSLDTTPSTLIPVLGNYFYYWLDVENFLNPLTTGFSALAIPIDNIIDGGPIT